MTPHAFGILATGEAVEACALSNAAGASVEILNYGCIVRVLRVPDRNGLPADVVLGFGSLDAYERCRAYPGAIVGRIAGRISGGILPLGGETVRLPLNDGPNHLHGGARGLDRRVWAWAGAPESAGGRSVRLAYTSPDGEEGYPGEVTLTVTYTLTDANALVVDTEAASDRPTPVSLTQHSYFNLAGEGSGGVLDHALSINADALVPAAEGLAPSDIRQGVEGLGSDLRRTATLRDALPGIAGSHGDLYLLRAPGEEPPEHPTLAAVAAEPVSGRMLRVYTNEACLQFYTGVALAGTDIGKSGRPYRPFAGLCLECQGYPHGTRTPAFGDILVRPGSPRRRRTVYAFSTDTRFPSPPPT